MKTFDLTKTMSYRIAEETNKILIEHPHIHLATARAEAALRIKAAE